jgi:hypothetical protein
MSNFSPTLVPCNPGSVEVRRALQRQGFGQEALWMKYLSRQMNQQLWQASALFLRHFSTNHIGCWLVVTVSHLSTQTCASRAHPLGNVAYIRGCSVVVLFLTFETWHSKHNHHIGMPFILATCSRLVLCCWQAAARAAQAAEASRRRQEGMLEDLRGLNSTLLQVGTCHPPH